MDSASASCRTADGEREHGDADDVPVPACDHEADHNWVIRLWVIVAVFASVAVARSISLGIPPRDPGGEWLRNRIAITLSLLGALVVADGVWRSRGALSARGILAAVRTRWTRERLLLTAGGLLAYHAVYFCYHNLKSWDAFNTVRDDLLTRVDRWLFLGHSPAVELHHVLGQQISAYVLVVIYESFPAIVSVSFVAALTFVERIRDGYVFIASMIWAWILGVASYYLIPSLGPFSYSPQDFSGLPDTIVTSTQAKYMAERAHLLADPAARDAYAQVSAFASLHVAITTVVMLMLHYYGLRRCSRVMGVYLMGTVLATVYLGWHFVADDIAGAFIAVMAVVLGRLTVYPSASPRIGFRPPTAGSALPPGAAASAPRVGRDRSSRQGSTPPAGTRLIGCAPPCAGWSPGS